MNRTIKIEGWKLTVFLAVCWIIVCFAVLGVIDTIRLVALPQAEDRAAYGNRIVQEWDKGGVTYFKDEAGRRGRFFKDKFK